jgi:spore coat protein U-like protein
MCIMRKPLMVALAVATLALPFGLEAQTNQGTITASATVQTPLNVTNVQDLAFGDVLPGVNKTVLPGDASAGQLQITGQDAREVSVDFGTLPTTLASGGNTMPITFGSGSAGWGVLPAAVDGTFDPASGTSQFLVGSALYVFLGGTVQPPASQAAGIYSADVTVTVNYTGS